MIQRVHGGGKAALIGFFARCSAPSRLEARPLACLRAVRFRSLPRTEVARSEPPRVLALAVGLFALLWGLCGSAAVVAQPAGPLLVNELHLDGEGAFLELLNPNPTPVLLDGFFITNAGNYPFAVNQVAPPLGGGFVAALPAGEVLEAGQVFVVSLQSAEVFAETWGRAPDAALHDNVQVATLLPAFDGAVRTDRWSSANGLIVVFWWDGVSDRVSDSDVIRWGSYGPAIDKTELSIDGPDDDTLSSTYAPETEIAQQWALGSPKAATLTRVRGELGEVDMGSNGLGGHDEMSEPWPRNFSLSETPTPGAHNLSSWPVAGRVVAEGTGVVAELRLLEIAQVTQSDETGHFDFGLVPEGEYSLEVKAPGFFPQVEPLQVAVGAAPTQVELLRAGSLQGRITLEGVGAPQRLGTLVEVLQLGLRAETDGDGDYLVEPMPPGRYDVRVRRDGFQEQTLQVVVDRDTRLDLTLRPSGVLDLGIDLSSPGLIPAGSRVGLWPADPAGSSFTALIEETGNLASVTLESVEYGSYTLVFEADGFVTTEIEGIELWGPTRIHLLALPVDSTKPAQVQATCDQAGLSRKGERHWGLPLLLSLGLCFSGTSRVRRGRSRASRG
ncbi:MAG: hypothetical protein COW42_06780 [Deltaproteobacteria bacterium CG17_big_fil_post_rev_8_21_14_2_50_63_7]|nr:MAG: hypothetical protein COW42_06780 [Deltaproteobacteria bacterium CG17_big_fil_post_rev_8_21_14_2_50_63_7]